jgi:DNA-binding CsgD family transcriptional regulator
VRFDLTPSEADVLALVARGLSNMEIARALYVSIPTVKTHVHRFLAKLGVASRVQAVLLARKLG